MPAQSEPLSIVVLGGGTVGSQVVRLLTEHSGDLAARVGAPLEVVGVAVRDLGRDRPGIPRELLTDDAVALVESKPDIVVEVMGCIEPAASLIRSALSSGASVVTANKALLAVQGAALHAEAAEAGVDLLYEAAVGGAIPLLRPLRESLAGDQIRLILGIVNGTTNYILTQMTEHGLPFATALSDAQRLGYAEADPAADVGGHDAAAKAAILSSLGFHSRVTLDDVSVEGITTITPADVAAARELGCVIKLLAIGELIDRSGADGAATDGPRGDRGGSAICVRVHPAMVPLTHPLAGVRDAFNAVFVEADAAGEVMFYGQGAGGAPTASAVVGDIVAAARNRVTGSTAPGESAYADFPLLGIGASRTSYVIQLKVVDQPGVLAAVAGVFAERGVSIQSLHQRGAGAGAELLIRTHPGREARLAETVTSLRSLPAVIEVLGVMRVIGEGR